MRAMRAGSAAAEESDSDAGSALGGWPGPAQTTSLSFGKGSAVREVGFQVQFKSKLVIHANTHKARKDVYTH